jgi:hypothetical protein
MSLRMTFSSFRSKNVHLGKNTFTTWWRHSWRVRGRIERLLGACSMVTRDALAQGRVSPKRNYIAADNVNKNFHQNISVLPVSLLIRHSSYMPQERVKNSSRLSSCCDSLMHSTPQTHVRFSFSALISCSTSLPQSLLQLAMSERVHVQVYRW